MRLLRRIRAEIGLAAGWRREHGQTTAEYALVIFAAAAVAFLLINWAVSDDGKLKDFFNKIIDSISERVD